MATEYTCITRKIEVHLHRHGDSEEALQRYKEEFRIWDEINDNLYKAANFITSHLFFNDAYIDRLRVQSKEYVDIVKALKKATDSKEKKELEKRRNSLDAEFRKQQNLFLKGGVEGGSGSEETAVRRLVVERFPTIPYDILKNLSNQLPKKYSTYRFDISIGKQTLPHYKKGIPVPFTIKNGERLALRKRDNGSIYVLFPKMLEWDLNFGRDRSNNREIVERVLSGQYDVSNSSIQEAKNGKRFLLLVVKIPKESRALNPDRVVGVDLGVAVPLYAALNDNQYGGMSIGSADQFLKVRRRMAAQKRELQRTLRYSTNGGHGRKHKLQALDRLEGKERNWVHLQNHIFSKELVEFALRNEAGAIQMERLTGFGHDRNDEVDEGFKFILRYWSFFELRTMIEYKAKAAGIEVRYVDPYHTSQTCSFCGHYEKGQRVTQSKFVCKNPDCTKGKGKERSDGTFEGINADWNAARNIALSDKIVERKKK